MKRQKKTRLQRGDLVVDYNRMDGTVLSSRWGDRGHLTLVVDVLLNASGQVLYGQQDWEDLVSEQTWTLVWRDGM